jgi:hypothetical protein
MLVGADYVYRYIFAQCSVECHGITEKRSEEDRQTETGMEMEMGMVLKHVDRHACYRAGV